MSLSCFHFLNFFALSCTLFQSFLLSCNLVLRLSLHCPRGNHNHEILLPYFCQTFSCCFDIILVIMMVFCLVFNYPFSCFNAGWSKFYWFVFVLVLFLIFLSCPRIIMLAVRVCGWSSNVRFQRIRLEHQIVCLLRETRSSPAPKCSSPAQSACVSSDKCIFVYSVDIIFGGE